MPTSPRKARVLLKKKKAMVVQRTPFTIQLSQATGENKQKIILGIDSGYQHIGLSATTNQKEIFAAEVQSRTDIVKLNSERLVYRRARRNRKTWYRKARFLNRTTAKKKEWFAPSLRHKIDCHIKLAKKIRKIIPISQVVLEVANFDIQKIQNPTIQGEQYQQGKQLGFSNVREYVLHRDGHQCQHCHGKSKDWILNVHHLKSRQVGGDRPDNLITLCENCHQQHHRNEINLKIKITKGFAAETFMTAVRWQIFKRLEEIFGKDSVIPTYGYQTKSARIEQSLPKSHINDAFVISGGCHQVRSSQLFIKEVRRSNRKLFKGIRSHIANTAEKYIHGFQRFDKVLWNKQEAYIFGRRTSGYFDLRTIWGESLDKSAKYSELKLLESAKTFLIATIGDVNMANLSVRSSPKGVSIPLCPEGQSFLETRR